MVLSPEQISWFKTRILWSWVGLTVLLLAAVIVMGLMLRSSSALAGEAQARDKVLAASNATLLSQVNLLAQQRAQIRTVVLTNSILLTNSLGAYNEATRRYGSLSNWILAVRLYQSSN